MSQHATSITRQPEGEHHTGWPRNGCLKHHNATAALRDCFTVVCNCLIVGHILVYRTGNRLRNVDTHRASPGQHVDMAAVP